MTPLTAEGKRIRREVIKLAQENHGYHFGGSFSVVEILLAYFQGRGKDDKLVFSKGHGWWPLAVMLREQGFNLVLEGHPRRTPGSGIEYTTGSLGHGFPAAVGMALARKIKKVPGRIVCIIGEGDVQEGTCWESLLIAGHHKLDNLTVIFDCNGIQGSGHVEDILPVFEAVRCAAIATYWRIFACIDAHKISQIKEALDWAVSSISPTMILAKTIKGRGVSFMENRPEWHAKAMDEAQTKQALEELA